MKRDCTPLRVIFWIILILSFINSYLSAHQRKLQRNILEISTMWIALNIVFYHTYHITRNNHNSISSWRRNRKKIQANGAIYFFSFFLSSKKKNSPVHRSWGKIVQWKSKRIRDVSHCLELAFVIRSEEKSALRRRLDRNCTNANRFEQKTVRKYGPIVTRISEILPCCFSVFLESQNFHELILVRSLSFEKF